MFETLRIFKPCCINRKIHDSNLSVSFLSAEDINKKKTYYPESHFKVEIEQKRWTEFSQLANRWISLMGVSWSDI